MKEKILNYLKSIKINKLYFLVFTLIIFKSIIFANMVFVENANKIVFNAYYATSNLDIYIQSTFIILSISFLFRKKKNVISLIVINIIVSLLMFANIIYFRGFSAFLSVFTLQQYKNLSYLSESIYQLISPVDLVFFIDTIVILIFIKYWFKESEKINPNFNVRIAKLLVTAASFTLAFNYDYFYSENWKQQVTIARYSPMGYHFLDLSSYIDSISSVKASNEANQEVEEWFKEKNKYGNDSEYNGKFKDKNVIYIQVESLENFVINQQVNGQEITPNLNKLLGNSYYFNNIHEQTYIGTSSDSDIIANTSLLPTRKGTVAYRFPNNGNNSLPSILRGEGYTSYVVHNGKGYFWNKINYLPSLGFNSYRDFAGLESGEMMGLGLSDKEHFRQLSNLIPTYEDKYYLFTVTESSHIPYEVGFMNEYLDLGPELNNTRIGNYFQSIRYTDEAIGEFITNLEEKNELDNTIVVIYGDHEGLHKYYKEDLMTFYNKPDWWENNEEVPFIVYSKDIQEPKTFEKLGGQVDTMPTVLSLLGVDSSKFENTAMGRNLLTSSPGYVLLKEGQILGQENLSDEEMVNVRKSFDISEYIIKTDYFKDYYAPPTIFENNGVKK